MTVGEKIKDTATLSLAWSNRPRTGTVTFKLYSDSGCKTTPAFESTNPPGGVSANGPVSSSEYTTTAAGTYYWTASYSGDKNNKRSQPPRRHQRDLDRDDACLYDRKAPEHLERWLYDPRP